VNVYRAAQDGVKEGRSALLGEFGLWFPGCLILINDWHLSGKLKGTRLNSWAPQWEPNHIWDRAIRLGIGVDTCHHQAGRTKPFLFILVKEFLRELSCNGDFAEYGLRTWVEAAQGLLLYLNKSERDANTCPTSTAGILRFLCVHDPSLAPSAPFCT